MKASVLLSPDELAHYRHVVERKRMLGTDDIARLYYAYVALLAQFQAEGE